MTATTSATPPTPPTPGSATGSARPAWIAALRIPTARTWIDVGVLLLLVVVAALGFEPSFGGYGFLAAALGGLVLGALLALGTAMLRIGALLTLLIVLVGYFLVGPAVAVPTQAALGFLPTLQGLASLAIGTVYGWADIVTLSTPIGAPAYIAVVPYAASFVVTFTALTLAVRWIAQRPRTAWRFAIALVGPAALYLTAILIGTDEPYQAGIRGVAFGVVAIVWLGWRRPIGGVAAGAVTRLRNRKLAGTAIVVVGAVLLGGAAGFVLAPPKDERFVLREEIEPPFDPLDYPSPLAGFRHYTKQVTDDVLFTVEGMRTGDVVRLATLDSFTGKLWNVTGADASVDGSGSYELVGRSLPTPDFITPEQRTDVTITIAGYDDVWVPGVGYPTDFQLTGGPDVGASDSLRYNASTGSMVLTTGLREGDSYTLDSEVQRVVPVDELADVGVAALELPPVQSSPDIVATKAQEFAGDATNAADQLERIRLALAEGGYLSHGRASDTVPSRAGHGADRVTELFERTQMIGDQEQYASAFALMARSLGYPARVVMGFAPEVPEGGGAVQVTGDDVTAWVEVAFQGVGWVAFDATPDETDIPQDQVPKPKSEPQPQVRQPPIAQNDEDDLLSPVELDEQDDDERDRPFAIPGWVWAIGLSLLIPAAIVFVPLLIIGAFKARRMRRRRLAAAGHDRVAGAWDELTDRYSELGYEVPQKVTRGMVALRLEDQVRAAAVEADPPRLRVLATSTDEAVFSGREVDEAESEAIWTEAMLAVEGSREAVSRFRRILARYRLRRARDVVARLGTRTPGHPTRSEGDR